MLGETYRFFFKSYMYQTFEQFGWHTQLLNKLKGKKILIISLPFYFSLMFQELYYYYSHEQVYWLQLLEF